MSTFDDVKLRLVSLFAFGGLLFGSTAFGEDVRIKFATIGINDTQQEFLVDFKQRLEAMSKGVKVDLYPGGQLGSIADTIRGVQLGTIEMFLVPAGFMKGLDPRFQAADAPGLFKDIAHAQRTFSDPEFRDIFLRIGEPKGVKGISIWTAGATDYATMAPVRTLSDFKGLKIRVLASELETKLMAQFGAAGIPMDMVDVQPALQNHVIDGLRTPAAIIDSRKLWQTAKFITAVEDTYVPSVAWVSMAFWQKISPELRQDIERVGAELEPIMLQRNTAVNTETYASMQRNGAEVIHLSDIDQTRFMKSASEVTDDVLSKPPIRETYLLLKTVAAKERGR